MSTSPIKVDFKGPIFKTDAGRQVKKAINKLIIEVSKEGVKNAKAEIVPGHGKDSGEFRKSIKRKKRGFTSRIFSRDARKAAWLEGRSKLNAKSRFKGYSDWERAYRQTDSTAGEEARKAAAFLVRELGG